MDDGPGGGGRVRVVRPLDPFGVDETAMPTTKGPATAPHTAMITDSRQEPLTTTP